MFHKFKITTCAFILCLFGLTLMTVSPVFAADEDSPAFKQCQQIKPHGKFGPMKQKKNCFRDLARILSNSAPQQTEPQMISPVEGGLPACQIMPSPGRIADHEAVLTIAQCNILITIELDKIRDADAEFEWRNGPR